MTRSCLSRKILTLTYSRCTCQATDGLTDFQNRTMWYSQFGHHLSSNLDCVILDQMKVKLYILCLTFHWKRHYQLQDIIVIWLSIGIVFYNRCCHQIVLCGRWWYWGRRWRRVCWSRFSCPVFGCRIDSRGIVGNDIILLLLQL